MKKLTIKEFIEKSVNIHGKKYDYSLVNFKNNRSKIRIICPEHGEFQQEVRTHINNGSGCPKCAIIKSSMKLSKNKLYFIEKSKRIHGDKYDYSLVEYKSSRNDNVKIICPEHGIFEQTPSNHYKGHGCPKCGAERTKNKLLKNKEEFIKEASKIHKNKYDYSLVEYKNARTKVKIICPDHGIFEQTPNKHLCKNKCPKCSFEKLKLKQDKIIENFKKVHHNKYDYSNVKYIDSKTKVEIICPKHGSFYQLVRTHRKGLGCPHCKESKGENIIFNYLLENNIEFIRQKRFKDCKDKKQLPFDFYLPDYNLCIEYDGEHHFNINHYCNEESFKIVQKHDQIKNDFCKNNNINLLRIKYNENIENKLKLWI